MVGAAPRAAQTFQQRGGNLQVGPLGGQSTAAPAQSPQAPQQPQTMRVKHLGTGQTGTIPVSEYDPKIYMQVQ
jgi:hypothetical protein